MRAVGRAVLRGEDALVMPDVIVLITDDDDDDKMTGFKLEVDGCVLVCKDDDEAV